MGCFLDSEESKKQPTHLIWQTLTKMAYIPKGNSAWLLRKAINRSDSAIADLETNLTTLARTASNTGTSTTTQVLFNDAGIVNGDAGLVYNKTTDALSVGGALGVTGTTTLTGAATVQGLTVGKGNNAIVSNTAFGTSALAAVTIATAATAIGNGALDVLTNGDYNTAIGNSALGSCTIGVNNTAIGHAVLGGVVSGIENTCAGTVSAYQATGDYNTGFGARTFQALTAGAHNTAIGSQAGYLQISGNNNGFFGANSYGDLNTASNSYNYGDGSVTSHKFRNGDVVLGAGNVVVASAKGIDFSATAGAGTSELLNDYEEGTWSPSVAANVNLTSVVSVAARYTKVGRLVTVSGQVTATVTTSNVFTYFALSLLPFANGTVTAGPIQENGNLTVGTAQVNGNVLWGFFPAASAIVSGAATFYYSVTYSV